MASVQLYVYDLSNGMARAMSRQLTGRQIDGIWHTSVVVFNKEVFYGQGIMTASPGQSHHGRPLKIEDMGTTSIAEQTWEEYLDEMSEHYTADKYHLLDFNCNSFTNDAIGFLTGNSIPSYIKDLPSDFLSTPFGAALRPTIDSMFRRPVPGAAPTPAPAQQLPPAAAAATQNPTLAASLLQAVAQRAASSPSGTSTPSTQTVAAPIQIASNTASFQNILASHRVVVAFFTSATCGPCRVIAPVFEDIAREKTSGSGAASGTGTSGSKGKIAFVKVDLGILASQALASAYSVRATPTFIFFLDGQKRGELKGINAPELRSQIELLLFEAFPPHPHTKLSLPAIEKLELSPILFSQTPNLGAVMTKLESFLSNKPELSSALVELKSTVIPWLSNSPRPSAPPTVSTAFARSTNSLAAGLSPAELFPLLDLWRVGILDASIATSTQHAFIALLTRVEGAADEPPRATLLTLLRLLANALGGSETRALLRTNASAKQSVLHLLVRSVLHTDRLVRSAAASAAFNAAAWVQRGRVARIQGGQSATTPASSAGEGDEDGGWDVELLSALVEGIRAESESEDVVHRLAASAALLVRLAPDVEEVKGLCEVLGVEEVVEGVVKGSVVKKKDVRDVVGELGRLCA
ncbi:DUF862-domain-containing protein [Peniophora sp. CONT]|nr:DUF862-domain-containing protein [Peniophora sp. CONT]